MNNLTKEDLIDIINTIKNQLINKSKRDFTIYTKYPETFNQLYTADVNLINILIKNKMKENKKLEYRMYFFVPYNLSDIQKGIQTGHCALEYAYKFGEKDEYKSFIENDKTWIILNGGTTNSSRDSDGDRVGSLNRIAENLLNNDVNNSVFHEPDLENALTAVCFLADERVYNYKKYPDYDEIINDTCGEYLYSDWVNLMGGEKNVFLRELIKGKKLA